MSTTVVPHFPVITAVLRGDLSGELTVNGTSHPIESESLQRLRAGVIARCSRIARDIGRPVRLAVTDGDEHYDLVVHPDAFVQPVGPDGVPLPLPVGAVRTVAGSTCRSCGRVQPLNLNFCTNCGVDAPHDVGIAPLS